MSKSQKSKAKKAAKQAAKGATADISKIDALIAEAKTKQAGRAKGEKPAKEPKATDPEKVAAKAAKDAERAAAKEARDQAREAKTQEREAAKAQRTAARAEKKAAKAAERAEKLASRKPAHLAKLEKAQSKLPALSDEAAALFATAGSLSAVDFAALAEHFAFKARSMQTSAALTTKLGAGDTVRIDTGKHAGCVGTVEKAQRIRCFVNVAGVPKPVYLFTSDVTLITPATVEDETAEAGDETVAAVG